MFTASFRVSFNHYFHDYSTPPEVGKEPWPSSPWGMVFFAGFACGLQFLIHTGMMRAGIFYDYDQGVLNESP